MMQVAADMHLAPYGLRIKWNMFGSASSSTGLNDSKLLSLRPPHVKTKHPGQSREVEAVREEGKQEEEKQKVCVSMTQ